MFKKTGILTLIAGFLTLAVVGCSSPPENELGNLGTEITQNGNGSASVFEIKNNTVAHVAQELVQTAKDNKDPNQYQVSKEKNGQILLWDREDGELVNLRQQGKNVIAEVDQKDFAKQHYSNTFLLYYFSRPTLTKMFSGDATGNGSYHGYTGTHSSGVTFETPEAYHASVEAHATTSESEVHVSVDAAR